MTKNKKFLVTTAIEETWENNNPILFLGEWCKLYSRKDYWSILDTEVLEYHWDNQERLYSDYSYLCALQDHILYDLTNKLNEIHSVDHSILYWRILIGPWLGYMVQAIFDRWSGIKNAINKYDITGTIILEQNEKEFIPQNIIHFCQMIEGDRWNHYIYSLIIKNIDKVQVTYKNYKNNINKGFDDKIITGIKNRVINLYSLISSRFVGDNDIFIIEPYISVYNNIKLQINFRQIPQLWNNVNLKPLKLLTPNREWSLPSNSNNDFEDFLYKLIPNQIPQVYLEGYSQIIDQINHKKFPKSPKIIFTSASLWNHELIKGYVADKVEKGTPLVYGQHGGVYGLALFSWAEEHERCISNKYLSWVWTDEKKINKEEVIAIGLLKKIYKRKNPNYKYKDLLLILPSESRYSSRLSSGSSGKLNNILDSIKFADALKDSDVYENLLVRTYVCEYGWSEKQRLQDTHPNIRINNDKISFWKLVKKSKLVVFPYNSTGYLELFSANIPTIIFWNRNSNRLRSSAMPFFTNLKRVGIYHETPESAAMHIIKIWNEVQTWWESHEVKDVLNEFINNYCNQPDDLVTPLQKVLIDN